MRHRSNLKIIAFLTLITLLVSLLPMAAFAQEPAKLIIATTTSTADSGFLDYILP
jgi:ABC-type tungstate transport system permease subunit